LEYSALCWFERSREALLTAIKSAIGDTDSTFDGTLRRRLPQFTVYLITRHCLLPAEASLKKIYGAERVVSELGLH
jgi:hypothetical protein